MFSELIPGRGLNYVVGYRSFFADEAREGAIEASKKRVQRLNDVVGSLVEVPVVGSEDVRIVVGFAGGLRPFS